MLQRQLAKLFTRGVLSILLPGCFLFAQDQWSWPEKPANLQVLPKDWPGSRLRPVMGMFVRGLGVTCSYCHVGTEGRPLTTYDFASDNNPNKNRAREMFRMLGSINDHLKNINPSGDKRVGMGCNTCHRGRPRPMTLAEELGEKNRQQGAETMIAHYKDLKENFLERGAYDFSERSLNNFGYELLGSNDITTAIQVLTLNSEQFPDSPNVWDSLAEGYLKAGDLGKAEEYYKKVLVLDPGNENATAQLKKIKDGGNE